MCFDGVKRLCHIRGKLRKKVWINQSDIVLIGLRDYQDAKAGKTVEVPTYRTVTKTVTETKTNTVTVKPKPTYHHTP